MATFCSVRVVTAKSEDSQIYFCHSMKAYGRFRYSCHLS